MTTSASDKATWKDQPSDVKMSCEKVIHVGDSTSIGMFDVNQLHEGSVTAIDRYLDAGAAEVDTSVFGARATNQGFNGNGENYASAIESVQQLLAQGAADDDTCWGIATGVNDAVNADAARSYGYAPTGELEANIRKMLDLLEGYRVMWPTAATQCCVAQGCEGASRRSCLRLDKRGPRQPRLIPRRRQGRTTPPPATTSAASTSQPHWLTRSRRTSR
ncbi:hypothetical protein [Corynebacterium sp. NML130628]|uniref:hypothetical protein n=1 Tax=Corynebacterium sp. NML130628 TaxID=1906333 RepID=UPI0008FBA638|nr:hypothetical protein [Corynebacterium sp. NML130628]OIR42828.1 hypothetical protein BJP07_07965 [Corynebacterium sp. NML130628]